MIADLKPYPAYRESGLPWIGKVPEHWKSERAKWLFAKMARPVREEDEIVTCFRDGTVTLRKNRRLRGYTEATVENGYQGIRKGDLVIHGMDAFAGAIGVSDSDGKGTPVYNVCQPNEGVNAQYYAHLIRVMSQSQWILALAKGIRERSTDFRFETFGNQRVAFPPLEEQVAIVRFLDWANGQLEKAIRAKRKVITLLDEQKQAIIHRAVTRGLDPSVPLKPSGISWLGDIPGHWEILRAKFLFRAITRRDAKMSDPKLSVTQARGVVRTDEMSEHSNQARSIENFQTCELGDLVVNKYKAHLGVFWSAPLRGVITPNYSIFVPFRETDARYFELLLHTKVYRSYFLRTVQGVTLGMSPLYNGDFLATPMPRPPYREQSAIIEGVRALTADVDVALSRFEREIELLREYRTRLVADVVTGKLDVREAAAKLSDEALIDLPDNDSVETLEYEPFEDEAFV